MPGIDRLFRGMRIAASALKAERTRVDVITKNISNARVTSSAETGEAYRREVVSFEPLMERTQRGKEIVGVQVSSIEQDTETPFQEVHEPGHPDADANGMVRYPNVNAVREYTDLITAMRAYEANIGVMESMEQMASQALRLAE